MSDIQEAALPDLPESFRSALESDATLPDLPVLRHTMSRAEFLEWSTLEREAKLEEAYLKLCIKRAKQAIRAKQALVEWRRPLAIEHARGLLGKKTRSFSLLENGVSGGLKQKPAEIEYVPSQESAFLIWDAEQGHRFTRWKMKFTGTYQDMERLKAMLPPDLSLFCEWEVAKSAVNDEWRKDKSKVPPGFKLVPARDDIKIDMPKLEAAKDADAVYLEATTEPTVETTKEEEKTWMP